MSDLYINDNNIKRGMLIINNNNINIIDLDENSNIIIKNFKESKKDFLDLLINNSNYFYNILLENNIILTDNIILSDNDLDIYNNKYFIIKNTKCLIGYKYNILSKKNIINILQNNINYNSKTKLNTKEYYDYLLIYV